jgi:predicted secreted protein
VTAVNLALAIGLYFVIWWTVLFAVLPWGVRSQAEAGEVVPGSEPAAPVAPMLLKKALFTSILAAIILAGVWIVLEYRPIPSVLPARH